MEAKFEDYLKVLTTLIMIDEKYGRPMYTRDKDECPNFRVLTGSIEFKVEEDLEELESYSVKLISKESDNHKTVHISDRLARVFVEEFDGYIIIIHRGIGRTFYYVTNSIDVESNQGYLKFQFLKNI